MPTIDFSGLYMGISHYGGPRSISGKARLVKYFNLAKYVLDVFFPDIVYPKVVGQVNIGKKMHVVGVVNSQSIQCLS